MLVCGARVPDVHSNSPRCPYTRSDDLSRSLGNLMTPGKLWPDADGRHPHAGQSWIGQACWTTLSVHIAIGSSARRPDMAALILSVPASLHADFGMRVASCSARWRNWHDTGVGCVTLRTPTHLAVAVLDVAGHTESDRLKAAASDGCLYAIPVAEELAEVTPLVPIYGFRDMLVEAAAARRLTAREFTQAVADVRADLRRPQGFSELSPFEQQVDSLIVNVCMPI